MGQSQTGIERWSDVRGVNYAMNPDVLPKGLVTAINNVELVPGAIGRRRPALQTFTITSITGPIFNVFRFVGTDGIDAIWFFWHDGTTATFSFVKSGATTTVAPVDDAPSTSAFANGVHAAELNNKLFISYHFGTSGNRLHVWDGTELRRVGLAKPAAPTAANTGAGAYAATARRYRVSYRIKSGSDIIVESELSDAVSFTPSGGGTAARVTKPATEDQETHWVVWGLLGATGDTYGLYHELAEIVVGTTTYDDSADPATYTGDNPAQLGLHIPPPNARYLLATDNRLLMAGSFATSAASDETQIKQSRVWFTRVLGSSDNGDDETIPNTTDQKNWVDCGEGDGDQIVGLGGPIDGLIYVFKTRSIWTLRPTGDVAIPYVPERLTSAVGSYGAALSATDAVTYKTTVVSEEIAGHPVLYFTENEAIYRISPRSGLERVNEDITPALDGTAFRYKAGVFWPKRRQVMWIGSDASDVPKIFVYTPRLAFRDENGVLRGGWSVYNVSTGFNGATAFGATLVTTSNEVVPIFAGTSAAGGLAAAGTLSATNAHAQDAAIYSGDAAENISASLTSAPLRLGQQGFEQISLKEPIVDASVTSSATPTIAYVRDFGTETRSATVPSLSASGSETRVYRKVEGLEMADARTVQVTYTWDSDQYGASELTGSILIPYKVQEPR